MKAGRRLDPDSFRRDPRDRPFPFGRFRKRPSMLSDLHGKHYNHKPDRDSADGPYYRPYNRYGYDPPMGLKHDRYGPGLHKVEMGDPRRHPYAPHYPRYHHHTPNTHYNDVFTDYSADEEAPVNKRPRLYVDISRRASMQFDTPNSADSSVSSNFESATSVTAQPIDSPAHSPPMQGTGLSAYLEDIDSDDDTLLRDEEEEKEPVKTPPEPSSSGSPKRPSKEELLQMMERVDRDIAATESQIAALQKKQAELKENAKASASSSSVPPTPSSFQPSPPASSTCPTFPEESSPVPSPSEERRPSLKRSLADTIYAENRPLYLQPSEAPKYYRILEEHKIFRPKLIEYVRKRKLEKHQQELKLCKKYDALMADWERRVSKAEGSTKRKTRDAKNRELFERVFPELKARREQQERLTSRVDQRGYGVVRSDAELNELMYELYEKEEASVRYRRTHAVIPAMVTDKREKSVRFHTSNGLIADPMAVYRESKFVNVWTDEEKRTFKEKHVLYPKNFEAVASFLPNKSTAECVKHYYLCKKNEHFKQLVRKANLKRRKNFAKSHVLPLTSHAHIMGGPPLPVPPPSLLMDEKPKMEPLPVMERADPLSAGQKTAASLQAPVLQRYGDWTEEEIDRLKEGLKKYGRAWGKIYREVGGRKTATQCKQFYDDFCNDESLDLQQALTEHGIMKNAEKARRKAESRKPVLNVIAEAKKKEQKQKAVTVASTEDGDSENTESASESESDESGSESTITNSSPEESGSHAPKRAQGSRKTGQAISGSSGLPSRRTSSEAALDLFISAAEVLNSIVPPDIALHDHTYALPPSSLINSVDFQGSSGLSLIAAAAAVVSPSLSRSAGSGKLPVLSPVRAPRGRPPNSQKRGSSGSISKLAPTLLSPAGSSSYVPLTDVKTTTFRGRTRSAPSDRPRSAVQIPRAPSTLSRISISSGNRSKGVIPPASYSRHRDSSSNSPSLKSMIASHPQQANSSTAAFEALVNVAVAAPPAELPRTSTSSHPTAVATPSVTHSTGHRNTGKSSSTPVTPVGLPLHQHQVKEGGTTTAIIDVNQAINILALASLAGQQSSSMSQSVPVQSLFAQAPILQPAFLGSIVAQNNGDSSNSAEVSDTAVNAVAYTSVGALLGQLTHSGIIPVVKPTVAPVVTTAPSGSNSSSESNGSNAKSMSTSVSQSEPTSSQPTSTSMTHCRPWENSHSPVTTASEDKPSSQPPPRTTTASDDLSNLNLLSTLVAAVAASQPSPPESKPITAPVTVGASSEMTPTSTEGDKRPVSEAPTVVAPFTAVPVMPQSHVTSTSVSSESLASAMPKRTESVPHTEHKSRLGREASPRPAEGSASKGANSEKSKSAASSLSLQLHTNCDELPTSVTRTIASALSKETKDASQQEHPTVSLPRSAVRTNPQALHCAHSTGTTSNDMTASLASIIPSSLSYPQQSTLLLYTRSLSFPLSATAEPPPEEEDHLESATRGISELSKLLGTDSSTESLSGSNKNSNSSYKGLTSWNQSDLLSNPPDLSFSANTSSPKTVHSSTAANPLFPKTDFGSEISKPFLSSLLESHGAVHNTSAPNLGNTNSNNSNIRSESNAIDCKHSR